jgi:hypothetical protein
MPATRVFPAPLEVAAAARAISPNVRIAVAPISKTNGDPTSGVDLAGLDRALAAALMDSRPGRS